MRMDNKKCLELIEVYRTHRVLWDPKHPYYHSKTLRNEAWRDVGVKVGHSVAEVKQKMIALMGSHRREKSRQRHCKTRSGRTKYVSKWFAYKPMGFLIERGDNKNNKKNKYTPDDTEIPDDIIVNVTAATGTSSSGESDSSSYKNKPLKKKANAKRSSLPVSNDEMVNLNKRSRSIETPTNAIAADAHERTEEALAYLQHAAAVSTDDCSIFCQHVANKLRKYDCKTKAMVEHAINTVLFDADMGKYKNVETKYTRY